MSLYQLYPDPKSKAGKPAKVDIIAVHGLGPPNKDYESHAWDTWGTSSSTEGHLWLRYELPRYLPDSRIYLYAYDAATAYGKDRDTFASKASELLEAIQLERDDISSRPIIFLGHSLGGLLIQQALINAQETPKYTPIRAATSGLVFFATPRSDVHTLGGNRASITVEELAAKLATAAGFPDGDGVVEVLKEGCIFSNLTQEHWRRQLSGYDIISFWGTLDNIVQEDSIRLDLPDNHETLVMLTANHNDVCNFGPGQTDQANLELVEGKLQELYKKATGSKDPSTNDRLPYCYIPLPRNDVFTGRETVLNELNEWLDDHSKQHFDYEHFVYALVGRSGVGKTQVALEFAYLVKDKHPECSIFWVTTQDPKDSSEVFSKDWANIAELLCVWVDGTEKNPKQQVREYLESDAAGRWLLIVDDAVSCIGLPASEQGLTIITTTPSDIHHILQRDVEPQERITELGVMTPEEATTLFTALAGQPSIDEEMTMELLKELECLPLAIIQAAAYINQNQIQTAEYLGLLQATDQGLADSMTWRFQRGHYMSGNSLARTLIVSLNQTSKSDSVATSLLEFLSCIHPKAIPELILPDIQSERTKHAIRMLCRYAFLTKCENSYDMHNEVHTATRIWVEKSGRRQDITTDALSHITAIGSIFLSDDTNNRKLQRECFPHALHALHMSEGIPKSEDMYKLLLYQLGSYLHANLRFDEAQSVMESAYYTGRKRDLPEDDIGQLRLEKLLAPAFLKIGRIEEATQMLEHLIAVVEKTPAYDDFNLPELKNQLAMTYMKFGRSEDAISLFEWVVNEHEMRIGDGLRLMSELYLAEAYFKVERNGEATKIVERVRNLFRNMSAEEQRQVLKLRHMHASTYLSKGRIAEAIEILEDVLNMGKTLEEPVQDQIAPRYDLARAYVEDGRSKAAIGLLKDLIQSYSARLEWIQLLAKAYRPKRNQDVETLGNTSGSFVDSGNATSCLPVEKVEHCFTSRELRYQGLRTQPDFMKRTATIFLKDWETFRTDNDKAERVKSEHKGDSEMRSELEQMFPEISTIAQKVRKIVQNHPDLSKENMIKHEQKLKEALEAIIHTFDVTIWVDLNGLSDLLDDEVHSFLTVTGSHQDAFADAAFRYVRWCWGQRGVEILSWVSLIATRLCSTGVKLLVADEDDNCHAKLELQSIESHETRAYTSIRIRLVQGTVENYYHLVADVASELAWITATFQQPSTQEGISFTRANITLVDGVGFEIGHKDATLPQSPEENYSTCWHPLFSSFNVAVGFPIPPRPEQMCGLELPLSVMISFARVEYPIEYKSGYVLKGWENALFPIRTDPGSDLSGTPSAVQWHLFTSKKNRLYMIEVENTAPDLHPITTKTSSDEFCETVQQTKRHFLGLYESSKIRIGTNKSVLDAIRPIPGGRKLRGNRLRLPMQWNRSINGSIGFSIFGFFSIGFSTGFRFPETWERRFRTEQAQTDSRMLDAAKRNSVILYDLTTDTAWMLPKVSVVLYLVQSWARDRDAHIEYPTFDEVIRNDWNVKQFLTQATPDGLGLEDAFYQFMKTLDMMQDTVDSKPTIKRRLLRKKKYLTGVDFAELVKGPKEILMIEHEINPQQSGKWLEMLKNNWDSSEPFRVVTLFCSSLPVRTSQPIVPTTDAETCSAWFPPPAGQGYLVAAMHCLQPVLTTYERDKLRLSKEYYWECDHLPYTECMGQGCNRLQKIAEGSGQRNENLTNSIEEVSPSASVVFGGKLIQGWQPRCRRITVDEEILLPAQSRTHHAIIAAIILAIAVAVIAAYLR